MINTVSTINNGVIQSFAVERIYFIRSESKVSMIYLAEGRPVCGDRPLKEYEEKLPEFERINRGILVNWDHVKGMKHGMLQVGTELLPVSRRHVSAVQRKLVDSPPNKSAGSVDA